MLLKTNFFWLYFSGVFLVAVFNRGIFEIPGINYYVYFSLFVVSPLFSFLLIGQRYTIEYIFIVAFLTFSLAKIANGVGPYIIQDSFLFFYPVFYLLGRLTPDLSRPSDVRKALKLFAQCVGIYGIFYPLRTALPISEYMIYGSYYVILYLALFYLILLDDNRANKLWIYLIVIAILVHSSRSAYFCGIVFITSYLVFYQKLTLKRLFYLIIISMILLSIAQALSSSDNLRSFSVIYMFDSIVSIFNPEYKIDQYAESLSGSRLHRIIMWLDLIERVRDPENQLFGIQSGIGLVDTVFRNPHNSYLSVIGRGGLAGSALYALFMLWTIRVLLNTSERNRLAAKAMLPTLFLLPTFSTLIDSPMTAIPFLYFIGLYSSLMKNK